MNSVRILNDRPHEECGVCAVVGQKGAAHLSHLMLQALQHRGQESAGLVSAEGADHHVHRGLGLVVDAFTPEDLDQLTGDVAIGHVRYSTMGASLLENWQPLVTTLRHEPVALGHNGNITNAPALRRQLKGEGVRFQTTIDSEVILHLISQAESGSFEECLRRALAQVEGAFSLVLLCGQTVHAVRDPRGFRPLVLDVSASGAWVVASESVAFEQIGAQLIRDVAPGEMIRLESGREPVSRHLGQEAEPARCIFELVYFSRPESVVDGRRVQQVRERLGELLWREQPVAADIVIPIPDTSCAAALGFARAGGLPFEIGLHRNPHVGRTFIEPHQRIRDLAAKIKHSPIRAVVEGKRVAVVDDSIVRGTTSREVIAMLRQAGASEIHLRIASPMWRHPCQYGIDTPNPAELLAHERTVADVQAALGCDSLGFLSGEGLQRAAGSVDGWCMACFNGEYPGGRTGHLPKEILEDDDMDADSDLQPVGVLGG